MKIPQKYCVFLREPYSGGCRAKRGGRVVRSGDVRARQPFRFAFGKPPPLAQGRQDKRAIITPQAGIPCAAGLNLRIPARVAARRILRAFGTAERRAFYACRSSFAKIFSKENILARLRFLRTSARRISRAFDHSANCRDCRFVPTMSVRGKRVNACGHSILHVIPNQAKGACEGSPRLLHPIPCEGIPRVGRNDGQAGHAPPSKIMPQGAPRLFTQRHGLPPRG